MQIRKIYTDPGFNGVYVNSRESIRVLFNQDYFALDQSNEKFKKLNIIVTGTGTYQKKKKYALLLNLDPHPSD